MLPQAAVVTKDALALVGGDHLPRPRLAVMMDTTVDGSIAIVVHQATIMMTAHQHGTNRPPTSRTENAMEAVSVVVVANEVVGNKSPAETIEVRLGHAREARARKTTTLRMNHQKFALLPKMSVVRRR